MSKTHSLYTQRRSNSLTSLPLLTNNTVFSIRNIQSKIKNRKPNHKEFNPEQVERQTKINQYVNQQLSQFHKEELKLEDRLSLYKINRRNITILSPVLYKTPVRNYYLSQNLELPQKLPAITARLIQPQKKKCSLRQKFIYDILLIKKKLLKLQLSTNQIYIKNLFKKLPYQYGKDIFKVVQENDEDGLQNLTFINPYVVHCYDILERTPLMCAVIKNNCVFVKQFIKLKSDVDHKDVLGNTAVHYACKYGYTDILSQLVQVEADLNSRNQCGKSPMEMCLNSKVKQILNQSLIQSSIIRRLLFRSNHQANKPT